MHRLCNQRGVSGGVASLHISRVQIIQEIQEDEQVLQRCRMEPAMLPPLVEHNPGIATAV